MVSGTDPHSQLGTEKILERMNEVLATLVEITEEMQNG
jgi:hypothetical protein